MPRLKKGKMAELFTNLDDFKAHVGGAISQTIEITSLAPVIADTARRHLVPYLSLDFYTDLVAAHAGTPSTEEEALLPYVQRCLALLTMYEYAKVGGIEFSEGGIHRIETDNKKTAYRYQEKQYSEYMIEKGYDALEEMLKFLESNISDYPDWATTEEAEMHLSPLLNYASDFRMQMNVQCDRYTFECLRPLIGEVETFAVQALVPAVFWADFKHAHIDDALTAEEIELRKRMRKAIAHRAMQEAIEQHWVQVTKGRIIVTEEFGEQSQVNRTSPVQGLGGMAQRVQEMWADRHTAYWKQYILDFFDSFTLVFDEDSGGTNTDADAWHINTEDEQDLADLQEVERKQSPVVWL